VGSEPDVGRGAFRPEYVVSVARSCAQHYMV